MSEDTKKILQKFFVTLRNNVNATAIYREVWGLTQFDRESITITQKTNTEAVDKLVDIIGTRSTRSFVSFVDALKKHGHTEIADNILLEAKQNYPHIHRALHSVLVLPTATVPPSSNTQCNQTKKCVENQAYSNSQVSSFLKMLIRLVSFSLQQTNKCLPSNHLTTLPEHLKLPPFFCRIRVAQFLFFCVLFCVLLFVSFLPWHSLFVFDFSVLILLWSYISPSIFRSNHLQ